MSLMPIGETYDAKPKNHIPLLYAAIIILVVGVLGSFAYTTRQIEKVKLPTVAGVPATSTDSLSVRLPDGTVKTISGTIIVGLLSELNQHFITASTTLNQVANAHNALVQKLLDSGVISQTGTP